MTLAITGDVLHRIPLLSNLNESEFHQIADVARLRTFAAGDYVIRQGDQSRDLWIVLEGQCEVVRRLEPNGQAASQQEAIVLAVLQPYSHFGEMSFFHPAPHSADVRASSPVKLLQITHADYADMIHDGIWAAYKLAYNVVQQLAERCAAWTNGWPSWPTTPRPPPTCPSGAASAAKSSTAGRCSSGQ